MPGSGHEISGTQDQPEPEGSIEIITGPTDGETAEGVISVSPPVVVGSGLARVMGLSGFDPHGAIFEHGISGTKEDDRSFVLVTTTALRASGDVPGYSTGHEPATESAQDRWHKAVAALRAFLTDPE